jgi:uncharacterized protein
MRRWLDEMEMTVDGNAVLFRVRVQPRASRDAIEGEHNGALKVRLTAPPVEGQANDSLRRLLAEHLNVAVSAVRIVAGKNNRNKRVSIAGVTRTQVLTLYSSAGKTAGKARG